MKLTFYKTFLSIAILITCLSVYQQTASAFTLTRGANHLGLLGWWTFDGKDMPNGVARDVSGNGRHGNLDSIATSTFYAQGKLGQGLNFDGVNDSVNLGASLIGTSPLTMCVWIYPKEVDNFDQIASDNKVVMFLTLSSDAYKVNFQSSGTGGVDSGIDAIKLYTWTHVCATRDASAIGNIYVNGEQSGTANDDTGAIDPSGFDFYLGDSGFDDTNFKGIIDDFRIYSRVLTPTEIRNLYNQGTSKQNTTVREDAQSGLVGHWTFDGKDMTNGVAIDVSGNNRHGHPESIATSTFYVAGKIGQGLNFDGVNDSVNLGSDVLGTTPLTVCAWIYPRQIDNFDQIISDNKIVLYLTLSVDAYKLNFQSSGTGGVDSAVDAIRLNRWTHVCGTRNAATLGNVYVDGRQSGTQNGDTGDIDPSVLDLFVGDSGFDDSNFKGIIDDVRIYSTVLSANEIYQLYNQGAGVKQNVSSVEAKKSGIVGHWTFDGKDMANGVARDVSGNGNNGNLSSISTTTLYVAGKTGQALQFDGTDDRLNLGRLSATEGASQVSWSFWAYTKRIANGNAFLSKMDAFSSGIWHIAMSTACQVGNQLIVHIATTDGDAGTFGCADDGSLALNQWKHYVVVFDGTQSDNAGRLKIYVDGVQDSSLDFAGTIPAATLTSADNVHVAANSLGTEDNAYVTIDDVRIFSRALTAVEAKQLYNGGR